MLSRKAFVTSNDPSAMRSQKSKYERSIVDMASLGYRATLHVNGSGFGELVKYGLHFLAGVDKPVTADDKSAAHVSGAGE